MEKIYAPIDNKNLMEDPFEDEVFRDFYAAWDHRNRNGVRHLFGHCEDDEQMYDAIVEVKWHYGDAAITITVLAVPGTEDYDEVRDNIFAHYERVFKEWECPENENLHVGFKCFDNAMEVTFWWEVEKQTHGCGRIENKPQEEPDLSEFSGEFRRAVEYVRENKTWTEAEQAVALEYVGKRMPLPENITNAIYDLMEEYGENNGYPEGWWLEEGQDEDDIFWLL